MSNLATASIPCHTWHWDRTILVASIVGSALLSACGGGADAPANAALPHAVPYLKAGSLHGTSQVRLLRYAMPAVRGGQTEANALLFIPAGTAPATGWPLVVWAHGTTGVADACAPSRNFDEDQDKDIVQALIDAGFAVLAPDYEGLDAPGVHPYLGLASQGQSITHAVRAAHEIGDVRLSKPWSVLGHSQGGFAALAAAQLAPEIAADYPLLSTVAMAPGTDIGRSALELFARMDQLQTEFTQRPSEAVLEELVEVVVLTATNGTMVAHGLQAQDPALDPGLMLAASFLPVAEKAVDEPDCKTFSADLEADLIRHVNAGGDLASYASVRRDLLQRPGIEAAFARNRPGQVRLSAPVLYLQGVRDTQTPVGAARDMVSTMRAVGSDVTYVEVAEGDHGSITVSHLAHAVAFIRDHWRNATR